MILMGKHTIQRFKAPNLTEEEIFDTFKNISSQKGAYNPASDYVELWMRAPEQIGELLPGPIGTAMAALALADSYLTETDKANLVAVLHKAGSDYSSGESTDSLLQLDNLLNRLGLGSTNKHLQSIIKNKVESNVAKTQKGNESSKFDEHIKNEQDINANLGKRPGDKIWSETNKKSPVTNAYDHWDKHKKEFPELQNSKQYVDAAHNFVRHPPEGTLTKVRKNGDTLYYNP